ncbi:hypothetical protein Tco_0558731 [Tanacetum coccineum]
MVHLATIWKGISTGPTSVPVLVSDIASVDRRILERTSESGIGHGNMEVRQLLFYSDRLEIQHIEASMNSKVVDNKLSKGCVSKILKEACMQARCFPRLARTY